MKTLLILRHAKSSWKEQNLPDHDRPLNKRGKNDAPGMGKLLKDEDLIPDLIISSTAIRAKKTAKLVAKACKYKGKIILNHSLYGAEPTAYLKILEGLSDKHTIALIVGHSPSVEETVELLTGAPEVIMPTCALAQLSLPVQKWAEIKKKKIKGKLLKVWRPKELSQSS
ncbi:MAG TPA: histidine phosphatase family protein [Nitrososphaeraceae archaeon]|nr:histidine phosphatase family protein [Nitrososphaeraceae archaeon]